MMNSAEENTDVLSFFDEYSTIINEALKLSYAMMRKSFYDYQNFNFD